MSFMMSLTKEVTVQLTYAVSLFQTLKAEGGPYSKILQAPFLSSPSFSFCQSRCQSSFMSPTFFPLLFSLPLVFPILKVINDATVRVASISQLVLNVKVESHFEIFPSFNSHSLSLFSYSFCFSHCHSLIFLTLPITLFLSLSLPLRFLSTQFSKIPSDWWRHKLTTWQSECQNKIGP